MLNSVSGPYFKINIIEIDFMETIQIIPFIHNNCNLPDNLLLWERVSLWGLMIEKRGLVFLGGTKKRNEEFRS